MGHKWKKKETQNETSKTKLLNKEAIYLASRYCYPNWLVSGSEIFDFNKISQTAK